MQSAIISTPFGAPPPPLMASGTAVRDVGPSPTSPTPRHPIRTCLFCVIAALIFSAPLLCGLGVASYFRLSSPTQALRRSVIDAVPGEWDKRIAINVGGFTLALVRFGSHFFQLPPEPKAALGALRGAEVGIYRLERPPSNRDYSAALKIADKSMMRQGWERIVGVAQPGQLVAVYMPRGLRAYRRFNCCVVVLNDQDLIVASGRGNVEPLLDLARQQLSEHSLAALAFTRP
jgi:hypothetical protein